MLDPLFPFINSEMVESDWFNFIDGVEPLFESLEQFKAGYDSIDAALSGKIKEIIENQWGKRVEDLQNIYVGQFHERLVEDGQVSYRTSNRYVLQAKFHYAQEPRRIIFNLTI
jgi:hypothetical protein